MNISEQAVETVERVVEAFNRRDVDMIAAFVAADFEWLPAMPGWDVEFRGGKISRLRGYLDHGEALRAAGLSE